MNIHFTPKSFENNLMSQTFTPSGKMVQRIFKFDKNSKNISMPKPLVVVQNLKENGKDWIVTDYEIVDVKSGKLLKSLKRDIINESNFETTVKKRNAIGAYDKKTINHIGDKIINE